MAGGFSNWGRRIGLGIGALAVALGACSDEAKQNEQVGSSALALTATQTRVLGFESIGNGSTDWTTTSGTLSQSDRHVEGLHALAIANGGNSELKSAALSSLGPIADKLSLDLLLPAAQPNPNWMGTLKVVIECPSQQLWYEGLAEYQLQGKPTDQFLRFDFPLSASTRNKLSTGTYSDLRVKILLNVAAGAGPWLLDRLWVGDPGSGGGGGGAGGSGGASGGSAGTSGSAGSPGASGNAGGGGAAARDVIFRMVTPKGVAPGAVALGAVNSLHVNDGVTLVLANGTGHSSASSSGSGGSYLGVQGSLQNLWSIGSVDLRNNATVFGNLTTSGTVSFQPGATVGGVRLENATLTPRSTVSWKVNFPLPNAGSVSLEPDVTRVLDPGNYGQLAVKSRAHLKLRRGTYRFESGAIEPSGYLDIDNTAGPVLLYFRTSLLFSGITNPQAATDNVLFGVGNLGNQFSSPWKGLLVANGTASLSSAQGVGHEGSIFADDIVIHQWTPFRHHSFVPTNFCDPQNPMECGPFCPCEVGGACDSTLECQNGLSCVVGTCRNCASGGCAGAPCTSSANCVSGLVCAAGECRSTCDAHPDAPECIAPHCANGVKDGSETDVDCGGDCPKCDKGDGCSADADCEAGMSCGTNNGACFGEARSLKVCWPTQCQNGVTPDECGDDASPCGKNCGCVVPCDSRAPTQTCPAGEVCKRGLGGLFGSPSGDVCVDPICPSNDPLKCGGVRELCGECVCTPDCHAATCEDPDDGCGGDCPGVCDKGETGCGMDMHCPAGSTCLQNFDGSTVCRPTRDCAFRTLAPPLCGAPGALCGQECPACTAQCAGRTCGPDPNCGTSCGSCGAGTFCDVQGQCSPTSSEEPPIVVPDGEGGERVVEDLPAAPTTPVGALKGQFSVSDQGSSEYSVPIEVPPGRAGLEPALTLKYAGSRANGEEGMGWRLDGLSMITRCPRTYALDGYSAPVKKDTTDLFCIDGKRLENVNGTYGLDGTEYRTLIESFARVVSYSETGDGFQHDPVAGVARVARNLQGPDHFKVWTKDGRILTYGRTRDSLVFGRDGVRYSWLLQRVEDRSGNTILVRYDNTAVTMPNVLRDQAASFVRPATIAYTGHGDQAGDREVRFAYEDRPDPQLHFLQGGLPKATQSRLSRITTTVKGSAVKNYKLEYGPGLFSQISKVFECVGADDAICKRPTKFDYVHQSGFTSAHDGAGLDDGGELDVNGDGVPDFFETKVLVGDVSADPKLAAAAVAADIVVGVGTSFVTAGLGISISVIWALNKNDFFGEFAQDPKVEFKDNLFLGTRSRQEQPLHLTGVQGLPCQGNAPTFFLDYDQDGNDDIVRGCGTGTLYVARSMGNGQFAAYPSSSPVVQYPVNGIRIVEPGAPSGGYSMQGPDPVVYDVNGDSLQDIVACKDQYQLEVRLRISETAGFAPPIIKTYPPATDLSSADAQKGQTFCGEVRPTHTLLDIDGDGAPDLLVHDRDGWKVLRYLASPQGESIDWATADLPDVALSAYGNGLSLTDVNGDGLTDITVAEGPRTHFWINAGTGHFLSRFVDHPTPAFDFDNHFSLKRSVHVDYDADGRLDFVEHWSKGLDLGDQFNVALLPNSLLTELTAKEQPADLKFPFPIGAGDQTVTADAPFRKVSDLDGDGNPDLFGYGEVVLYGSGARNALLSRVEDGLGKVTSISYDLDDTYQHPCLGKNFPETCVKRLNGLVGEHAEGFVDSIGHDVLERHTRYNYVNARINVAGHGWLGFERRIVQEQTAGRTTTIDFEPPQRYDLQGQATQATTWPYFYPKAGLPKRVIIDDAPSSNAPTSPLETSKQARRVRVDNTWQLGKSDHDRLFPELVGRSRAEYERPMQEPPLDVETNGSLRFECHDSYTSDAFGNTTRHTETCQSDSDDFFDSASTLTTFTPDTGAWLVSNPELVTVVSIRGPEVHRQHWDPEYDSLGRLSAVTREPDGSWHKTQYLRNGYGNVEQVTESVASGEASRTTAIDYDFDEMFPVSVTNAEGHVTQVHVDEFWGEPATIADANGITVQRSYDGFGTLSESHDATGLTSYALSQLPAAPLPLEQGLGQLSQRVRIAVERQGLEGTSGGSSAQELDYLGRLVGSEAVGLNGAVVSADRVYDALGRLSVARLPHTANAGILPSVSYSYDHLDRVVRVDHSDGTFAVRQYASAATLAPQYSHFVTGLGCRFSNLTKCAVDVEVAIDEDGHQNAIVRDLRGLVLRSVDGQNIPTTSKSSNYSYGAFGRLIGASDNAGIGPTFTYDPYGRLLVFSDPDVGSYSQTYNGYDELKTRTDPKAQSRTYSYDRLGRTKSIIDPAGTTQWIYDQGVNATGRLSETISPSSAQSPSGQRFRYTYEAPTSDINRGLPKRIEYLIDETTYGIDLAYDDLGRTREVTYPHIGGIPIVSRSSYDPASGALTGVDEVGSGVARSLWRLTSAFQGHLVESETFGNGAVTSYNYDPDRRWLAGIHTTLGSEAIQSIDYAHYGNGQLLDRLAPGSSREYTYDSLTRLSTVATTTGATTSTASYSYNDSGNIVLRGSRSIEYWLMQPHLVKAVGATRYTHDSNGNVLGRVGPDIPGGSQTFDYTPFDLPKSITTGLGAAAKLTQFDYTADESRVVRRDPDTTRHFVTDLYQRLISSSGTTLEQRFRIYAGDRALGEIVRTSTGDKTLYFHQDHLGTPDTISSSTGETFHQDFDPWGEAIDPPATALTRVGFTGHQEDLDLGLTDMGGRIYDPLTAQFTSADPVMQAPFWSQGLNRYSYVFNDPINSTDPSGFAANDVASEVVRDVVYGGHAAAAITAFVGFGGTGVGGAFGGSSLALGQSLAVGLPGAPRAGGSYTLTAPTAAPRYNPAGGQTANNAVGNAQGGVGNAPVQERAAALRQRLDEMPDLRTADVGSCVFNPQACALALEQAVVRAAPWILRILPAVEGAGAAAVGSEAIILLPLFIPGDSVIAPGDSVVQMGGEGDSSSGRPSNNAAQNRQARDAIKEYEKQTGKRLSKDQVQQAHREFGRHPNPGYRDLVDILKDTFGG